MALPIPFFGRFFKMKIRMLTSMAGADFSHNFGDEIEVTDAEGKRFIEAGIAEPVVNATKIERAVKKVVKSKATKK